MQIAEAVIFANDERKRTLVRRVAAAIGGSLRGKMIGVWGLTYKPGTDTLRIRRAPGAAPPAPPAP